MEPGVSCNGAAVGYGTLPCTYPSSCVGPAHALLWLGSSTNYVDLHPAGFATSYGLAISGKHQVGYGTTPTGYTRALIWSGGPETAVNLHAFLPAGFLYSNARSIDEFGNILGMAGTQTYREGAPDPQAVLWVPDFGNGVEHYLWIAPLCPVGGRIEIQLAGVVGATYGLEKSEDLSQWRPVGTFTLSNPLQIYEEPTVDRTLNGFFRSVMVGASGEL